MQRAHRSLSFQLSGSQLGITMTTLVTGYIAEPAIAELFRPGLAALGLSEGVAAGTATVLALVLATALSMVFGELVPKNLAIADPLRTARAVVWLQAGFAGAFRWLITALNASANAIVRRLGVEPAEELRSARSPRELSSLVRASAQHGTLDAGTATLLDRSLRFTDRVAEDLMTPRVRVETLDADDTVADLVALARRSGFSRFPVHDGDPDTVLGVVHVKQAFGVPVGRRGRDPDCAGWRSRCRPCPSRSTATRCSPGCASPACRWPWSSTSTAAPPGIVTLEDLVEEIVGDVRDEHDRAEQARCGRWAGTAGWSPGCCATDEVAEATGFRMPSGAYETLAGLVLARAGPDPRRRRERRRGRLAAHRDAPRPQPGRRAAAGPARSGHRERAVRRARAPRRRPVGSDLLALLAAVALLAANAFFVGAEFALVSARRDRLEAMAEAGIGGAPWCCGPAPTCPGCSPRPSWASRSARCCWAASASPRSRT